MAVKVLPFPQINQDPRFAQKDKEGETTGGRCAGSSQVSSRRNPTESIPVSVFREKLDGVGGNRFTLYTRPDGGVQEKCLLGEMEVDYSRPVFDISTIKSPGNSDFLGIGTRLHQAALEYSLLRKKNEGRLHALRTAIGFHFKAGWRAPERSDGYGLVEAGKQRFIDAATLNAWLAEAIAQKKDTSQSFISGFRMELPQEKLEIWKKIIAKAPILNATRRVFNRLGLAEYQKSLETLKELYLALRQEQPEQRRRQGV